jgi:hypothetical protein
MVQSVPIALSAVAFEDAVVLRADADIKWLLRLVNCIHGVIFISQRKKFKE